MTQKWSTVYLGIGSNKGNRKRNISAALMRIAAVAGIRILKQSPLYETKPMGGPAQRDFLNGVLELVTDKRPHALLNILQSIERQLGREPGGIAWGPRSIDLDILLYDRTILRSRRLSIPHPRMHERCFVLIPLNDIAPRFKHPLIGKTVQRLLRECTRDDGEETMPYTA